MGIEYEEDMADNSTTCIENCVPLCTENCSPVVKENEVTIRIIKINTPSVSKRHICVIYSQLPLFEKDRYSEPEERSELERLLNYIMQPKKKRGLG